MKKNCINCGAEYEPIRSGENSKYCSDKCRNNWHKTHGKEKYTYTCQQCGKEYNPKNKDRNTYCSRKCYFNHIAAKPIESNSIICTICGKEYTGKSNSKYCSDKCKAAMAALKNHKRLLDNHSNNAKNIKCKECGILFIPEYGNKHRTYCSADCAKQHSNKSIMSKMHKGGISKAKKQRIYERDNYICQLCGKPLNMQKSCTLGTSKPHNMAPTIDHIIPVSIAKEKGWSNIKINEENNLQAAHLICNINKSNRETQG